MDRVSVYRNQQPYEQDVLEGQQFAMEAFGLMLLDFIGDTTQIGGFECIPTAPASLAVEVGPGRIYKRQPLEATDWAEFDGTGGLPADTDAAHEIIKQGIMRDAETFATPAPVTIGHSIKYLIEVEFAEEDDPAETVAFYNVSNPGVALTQEVSRHRRLKATAYIQASASSATPTVPAATAGRVPVWVVTVAYGDTTVTAPDIAEHDDAPFVTVGGGGGGGGGLAAWQSVTGTYTAVDGDRLLANTTGGAFTLTLPATPAAGDEVTIKGSWATNDLTIARNGQTINGSATDLVGDKDNQTLFLVFDGTTWLV